MTAASPHHGTETTPHSGQNKNDGESAKGRHGKSIGGNRKVNKPLMEKRRRARINKSLAILKELVVGKECQQDKIAKLEKADILDLTVSYIQNFHCDQKQGLHLCFNDGYKECSKAVKNFLNTRNCHKSMINELMGFLHCGDQTKLNSNKEVHSDLQNFGALGEIHGGSSRLDNEQVRFCYPKNIFSNCNYHEMSTSSIPNEETVISNTPLDLSQYGTHRLDPDSVWRPWRHR